MAEGNIVELGPHSKMTPTEALAYSAREDWEDVIIVGYHNGGDFAVRSFLSHEPGSVLVDRRATEDPRARSSEQSLMPKPAYYCPECEECIGYVGRFFAFLFGNQFHHCRRKHMPVSLDSLAAKMSTIAADVTKLSAELANAAALQAQNDQLKAENATLQASLDAANAADAAAQTQASTIEAQADSTIAALAAIPATAPAPAPDA